MPLLAVCLILMTAILDQFGRPVTRGNDSRPRLSDRTLRARYDAAQTTDENSRHWQHADELSARAALSPDVRRVLRIRARYELANCPLARGIINRMTDYVVGTGPTLRVKTPDLEYNRAVQRRWTEWSIASAFAHKLWLLKHAELESGEAFGLKVSNPGLRHPVKLALHVAEADIVASEMLDFDEIGSDGIAYDAWGNPSTYRVLRAHPGDFGLFGLSLNQADIVPARFVCHLFREERPGQLRGVPPTTSALPLFALRRRYMLAVVSSAEDAANVSGVIHTQGVPEGEEPDDLEPLDLIETVRRMLMVMPKGWKMEHLKQEQPTTTFDMFDRCLIREVGRAVDMPYGLAAADSSDYNFASGKLDLQPFFKRVARDQDQLEDVAVEPCYEAWWDEGRRLPGYFPPGPGDTGPPQHVWLWDGQDFLDPRESSAKSNSLQYGMETLPLIYARRGLDFDSEIESGADALGLTVDEYKQLLVAKIFASPGQAQPADEPDGETDDEETEEADA